MATEHDHRPIWALPQPADRKPRYTREQIADAALRIADAGGFDAVTMKRIAAQLGAATMTLYYYVRNKTDIVALMQRAGERRPRDRRELRDQSLAGDLVFSVGQLVLGHYPIDVFRVYVTADDPVVRDAKLRVDGQASASRPVPRYYSIPLR